MSKVYSFRLSDDNPREVQAREVIEAWVEEGYSLRYTIVEALLTYEKDEVEMDNLQPILEQIQKVILTLDKGSSSYSSETALSNSFVNSVKQSVRLGLSSG